MSALRNLSAMKRNIARRIRQALEEIQENLSNRERVPVPVSVPVPMRGGRAFRTPRSPYNFGHSQFATFNRGYYSTRFYTTYTGRFTNFNNMRWSKINGSLLFQNFSSRGQFRLKLFSTFYRAPALTELIKKRLGFNEERENFWMQRTREAWATTAMQQVPLSLRLNILLTQRFHDMVMDLASPAAEAADGCFVDFKIEPKILIPSATMMSAEVLTELLANLKHFEKHLIELQRDLTRLSELGELPLRFLANKNTIRVYFPNCDRAKLEALLLEKNVSSGTVYEDARNEIDSLSSDEVSSVSEFDILSSCNMLALLALSESESCYDDVLSSSRGSVGRQENHIEIFEEDSYCWA